MNRNLRIGEVLTEKGYVTEEQMTQALAYQKEHRDMRIGQILRELGFVTENQVLDALASRLNLKIVDVAQLSVDLTAVEWSAVRWLRRILCFLSVCRDIIWYWSPTIR